MDIPTKTGYLKQYVQTIATHDDAPEAEVRAALTDASDQIAQVLGTLTADRAARMPAPAPSAE